MGGIVSKNYLGIRSQNQKRHVWPMSSVPKLSPWLSGYHRFPPRLSHSSSSHLRITQTMVYTESIITMALMTTASSIDTRYFIMRVKQVLGKLGGLNVTKRLPHERTQSDNPSSPITLRTILHLSFVGYAIVIITSTPIARERNLTLAVTFGQARCASYFRFLNDDHRD